MLQALRIRDFRLLWIGSIVSDLGSWLLILAIPAHVFLATAAMFMTSRRDRDHPGSRTTIRAVAGDLINGIRVLRRQPVARALLSVTIIFLAANASLSALLIPLGVQRLGGSEHTGVLLSCLGVGFLLGAPVLRALTDPGPAAEPAHGQP